MRPTPWYPIFQYKQTPKSNPHPKLIILSSSKSLRLSCITLALPSPFAQFNLTSRGSDHTMPVSVTFEGEPLFTVGEREQSWFPLNMTINLTISKTVIFVIQCFALVLGALIFFGVLRLDGNGNLILV